uniref:Ran GTPase binding protein n=1 Tax=Solanum tuberosum TaxID=4113 RepID=V9H083_SOLTU|nr:unknown [Solanum tuberosum]
MMLRLLKHGRTPADRLSRRWMSSGSHSKTTVMSFGDGSHGALGLPSSIIGMGSDAYEPTPIPGLPPDIVTVAAGHFHSLAVTSEGHVWAWGRNNEGQLGVILFLLGELIKNTHYLIFRVLYLNY